MNEPTVCPKDFEEILAETQKELRLRAKICAVCGRTYVNVGDQWALLEPEKYP